MNQLTIFDRPNPETVGHSEICPTCSGSGRLGPAEYRRLVADRPGAVGKTHPETSKKAARTPSNVVRFGTQRHLVLCLLGSSGPMTAAEVALQADLSRNQTATRLGECRDAGLVRYVRDANGNFITRPTGPTDEGRLQEITPAGIAAIRAAGT